LVRDFKKSRKGNFSENRFSGAIKMIGMADQLYVNFWLIFGVKKVCGKRSSSDGCVEIRDGAREGGYRMVASSGFLN